MEITFPTKKDFFAEFSYSQIEYFINAVLQRDEIYSSISQMMPHYWQLREYNSIKQTFEFVKKTQNGGQNFISEDHSVPLERIEVFNVNLESASSKKGLNGERLDCFKNLVSIEDSISRMQLILGKDSAESSTHALKYKFIVKTTHEYVGNLQSWLKKILNQIICQKEDFLNSEEYKDILKTYSNTIINNFIPENGKFEKFNPFALEKYFMISIYPDDFVPYESILPEIFKNPLISFLVEFIIGYGTLTINKCAYCDHFFLRTRNNEKNIFCSTACKANFNRDKKNSPEDKKKMAEYMKGYRANKKALMQRKNREAKIKHFMNHGGYTREEAEVLANIDDT